jgi:hypothetical protein
MATKIPLLYMLIAVFCLPATFASAPRGMALAVLPLVTLPFAFASLALGAAAWSRRGLAWLEVAIAALWGVGAVARCVVISAPPLEFESVFVAIRVQGFVSGLAAVGMLLAAFVAWRSPYGLVPRILQTGAVLALAAFLTRGTLLALGVLPSEGGINAISYELWLTRVVVVGCALTILGSLATLRLRRPRGVSSSRPTRG